VGTRLSLPSALAAGMLLAACGGEPSLVRQASSQPPVEAPHVAVSQTGDGGVAIAPDAVRLRLDAAGLLVVDVGVRSTSTRPQNIVLRARAVDASGRVVGEAGGGAVRVAPGSETTVELSGPPPSGTIAAVTVEVRTMPAVTATAPP
jgi:hypothetical protein